MPGQGSPSRPPLHSGEHSFARVVLALIVIEVFAVFETSMAFAAAPTFMRAFDADAAAVGWTGTAYLLVGAASAATCGRLGDIFGRRKVLVVVLGIAVVGSLVSTLAPNLWIVVLGRGLQGFAAGALPLSFGVVRELLPARQVPLAMTLIIGMVSICTGIGAFLAGVLIDLGGWRAMFVVATVLGVAAAATALVGLPRSARSAHRPRIDVLGGVLLAPAAASVLFGLTQSRVWGWGDARVIVAFAAGIVGFGAWIWWERRTPEPMVDLRLFRHRKVALTTLATVAVGIGPLGTISFLTHLMLQLPAEAPVGLGLSPTTAGALLLVQSVIGYAAAAASGRIAQVAGARWSLAIGTTVFAAGALLWMVMAKDVGGTLIALCLTGIGVGFSLTSLPVLIVEVVPEANTGEATGMNRVTQNIAVAVGISLASLLLASSTVPGTTLPTQAAMQATMLLAICTSLAGLVLALLIRGDRGGRETRPADERAVKVITG